MKKFNNISKIFVESYLKYKMSYFVLPEPASVRKYQNNMILIQENQGDILALFWR